MAGVYRLVGFLLLPILTRLFSPEEYGIIDIVAVFTSLISIFAGLSLPSAVARYYLEHEEGPMRSTLISSLLLFVAVFGLIWLLLGLVASGSIANMLLGNPGYGAFISISFVTAALSAISAIPKMVLRMERKVVRFNLLNILHAVVYVGSTLVLVIALQAGLIGVFWALVVAEVIQLVLGLILTKSYLAGTFSRETLRRSLKFSLPIVPAVLVTWVNQQTDRIVILAYLGIGSVGIFAAGARIGVLVSLLTNIFSQAWTPFAMAMIKSPEADRDDFFKNILSYYAGIFAALGLFLTALAPEVVQILLPVEYQSAYLVIPWIVGAAISHASGQITNIGVLISEKTYANSIAAWSGAIVNVGLAIFLIPIFGLWGAAIGMFVAELMFSGILWRFSMRFTNIRFDRKRIILILSLYISTSAVIQAFATYIENPTLSPFARLLVAAIVIGYIMHLTLDQEARDLIKTTWGRILAK